MSIRILALMIVNAALLLPVIALIVATFRRNSRLKNAQDRFVAELDDAQGSWHRINVSRHAHFQRRLKLLPIEGKGVLVKTADEVRIVAAFANGERLDHRFPAGRTDMRWLGNATLASGNLHWLSLRGGGRELMVCADTGMYALPSREATADLYRRLGGASALPDSAKSDFALEKNPASGLAVVLFFLLLAYSLLDGVIFNPHALLDLGKAGIGIVPFAIAIAAASYPLMTRKQVPSRESLALALLLAVAVGVAYVPAIKRLDLALAGDAWREMAFVKRSDTRYEAVTPGPPAVRVPRDSAYWKQFAVGEEYTFEVIQGPLGVWQLDPRRYERLAKDYDADRVKAAAP